MIRYLTIFLFLITIIGFPAYAKKPIICIDPGHGTKNSRAGTKGEAEVVLQVAKEIGKQLQSNWNIKVVYTRSKRNEDIGAKNPDDDNRIRAQIANQSGASLFLRLHADAADGKAAIYYPQKHPNSYIASSSKLAAEYIWTQIKTILPPNIPKAGVISESETAVGSQNGGLLIGSFYSKIPVVLIEMVPMNKIGKEWISQKENQQILAEAIIRGIHYYLKDRCFNQTKSSAPTQDAEPHPLR